MRAPSVRPTHAPRRASTIAAICPRRRRRLSSRATLRRGCSRPYAHAVNRFSLPGAAPSHYAKKRRLRWQSPFPARSIRASKPAPHPPNERLPQVSRPHTIGHALAELKPSRSRYGQRKGERMASGMIDEIIQRRVPADVPGVAVAVVRDGTTI